MKLITNLLRLVVFFPICILAMGLINWALGFLLLWLLSLGKFWFFVVVIFLGGAIWGFFKLIASLLVTMTAFVSPVKWLSATTLSVLSLVNGVSLGYLVWTIKDDYNGWEIFGAIIATVLVLELTFALIQGALAPYSSE